MKRLTRVLTLAVLFTVILAPAGSGQVVTTVDTLDAPDRTSWEDGNLSLFSLDRFVLGGRALAMGGAGLALLGGAEYHALNPAAILGAEFPELLSEARIFAGGAGANDVPSTLGEDNARLEASNYRVRPRESLNYSTVSVALPVTILGNRGALGGSYNRVARTGAPDETRVELKGQITNQAAATYGLGDEPEQGLDAITLTAGREITSFLNLGVNLNWASGTLARNKDIGVAVFGFEILNQNFTYEQKAKGFNIDVGGQVHVGNLSLAGAAYLGHDLEFTGGKTTALFVPDTQALSEFAYVRGAPLDHTLSVPTSFGFGGAYALGGRTTVAGDFWIRPWGHAEITRAQLDPAFSFADSTDVASFMFDLVESPNETETFWAGLENANSLRLGLEYLLVKSDRVNFALRGGFRKEKLPLSNVAIPREYSDHGDFASLVFQQYCLDNPNADACQGVTVNDPAGVTADLNRLLEHNQLLFRGSGVDATAITLGFGIIIRNFSADLGIERLGYDLDRFFLQEFDPLANPIAAVAHESRGLMSISLSMKMRF